MTRPNAARRSKRDSHIVATTHSDSPESWAGDGKLCIDHEDEDDLD